MQSESEEMNSQSIKPYVLKNKWAYNSIMDRFCLRWLSMRSRFLRDTRGSQMIIYANDFVGNEITALGYYESEELNVTMSFLAPFHERFLKSTAIDAGANIGNHSIFFSRYFEKIIAIEPHPTTFSLLSLNSRFHSNIIPKNLACSSSEATLELVEDQANMGASKISNISDGTGSININAKPIDSIIDETEDVSMIKLDIEGHELEALWGSLKCIERHRPIIIIEQREDDFTENETPAITFLRTRGYHFFAHKKGVHARSSITHGFQIIFELIFGRTHRVSECRSVSKGFYPMLIAIHQEHIIELNNR